MNLIQCGSQRAEGAVFGINHDGTEANWFLGAGTIDSGGPWPSDGLWYWIDSTPTGTSGFTGYGTYGDFAELTGLGGALLNSGRMVLEKKTWPSYAGVFKGSAPYSVDYFGDTGVPANGSPVVGIHDDNAWSDVEIKQVKGLVTMSVNHTPIFVYNNSTAFTNGYPMLGYECALKSAASPEGVAYFSDLKVVSLAAPVTITNIQVNSGTVTIAFDAGAVDTADEFTLQAAPVATGPPGTFADVSATITSPSAGQFQAVIAASGDVQFYRIRRIY